MNRCLTKDFYHLMNNIDKLSDGQARICEWDSCNVSKFVIEVSPSEGPYKGGKFKFKFDVVELFYPILQPDIKCITPIYHPNIDTLEPDDNDLISNVCVSILDDWKPVNGLDDCIQALLYLFYQPNTTDSLRLADGDITENQFLENVQKSLKGGTVEGCFFHPNYGWVENSKLTDDLTQYECKPEPPKKKLCKRV
ncbi:NEDD8-conjugating enzyme Ubc12-like [Mytilus trossulus]|uniref:NEDD8-conjugating enzyme Ubc12-like n=1 Tax=Mytilus trossulus TaxID=6551 RepID=UPI003006792A